MDFKNNQRLKLALIRLKENLYYMCVGLAALAAIGAGFAVLIAGIIFAPLVKWWRDMKLEKNPEAYRKNASKVIDADYKVIDDEEHN